MKQLLKEKDFSGRNALWYMAQNNVYRVLDTRIMDRIISDYWRSEFDVTGSLFEASTSYRILTQDNVSYVKDYEKSNRFNSDISVQDFKSHPF